MSLLLPIPNQRNVATHLNDYGYSLDQLKACRAAAFEEAVQAVLNAPLKTAMQPYREACANAIRSLK